MLHVRSSLRVIIICLGYNSMDWSSETVVVGGIENAVNGPGSNTKGEDENW
jgi:hypothetical protein